MKTSAASSEIERKIYYVMGFPIEEFEIYFLREKSVLHVLEVIRDEKGEEEDEITM